VEFRQNARPEQETYSEPILNAVFKVLVKMATSKMGSDSTETPGSESSDEHAGCLILRGAKVIHYVFALFSGQGIIDIQYTLCLFISHNCLCA
jgi:hypothetical protein